MKRYKLDDKFMIACVCGCTFEASANRSILFSSNNDDVKRQWECPDCGQIFLEKVKTAIELE